MSSTPHFQRILIAVDDSPIAALAADRGFELAARLGAIVGLVYVIDPQVGVPEGAPATSHEARQLVAALTSHSALVPEIFVASGAPATEIVATAREWKADLVVIGSHGRGRIKRLLLGSVADAVMRHAPCATLVIPAEPT